MINQLLTPICIHELSHYAIIYVGFSGGLDSTVLLHCLAAEPLLLPKLRAIHINHGLSPNASAWEAHCRMVCETLHISLSIYPLQLSGRDNLEARARAARHYIFKQELGPEDTLVLAHHQNDQAETLLLNLLRGAGVDGMAAMLPTQSFGHGTLRRPLLPHTRSLLETYAKTHQLVWVEDESNQNQLFSRNFIRHRILPVLQEKWPAAVSAISRAAQHCQQAKQNLATLAKWDGMAINQVLNRLPLEKLRDLSPERALNLLRAWLNKNQVQQPSEKVIARILKELVAARVDATPSICFGNVVIRRYRDELYCFRKPGTALLPSNREWIDFPAPFCLGVDFGTLKVESADTGMIVPENSQLTVCFRQGGERFRWRGQTKCLKKLLQAWGVPPWKRDKIPLIKINGELAAIVGYAVSDLFFSTSAPTVNIGYYAPAID